VPKKHFMIDIETMGIRPSSAIVSVGIVHFDERQVIDKFYTNCSLSDSIAHGLTTDQSTIDWWAGQPADIRGAWDRPDAPDLLTAMKSTQDFIFGYARQGEVCPWGNGVDFDVVVMNSSFAALGAESPWKFYNHMCFRTLKNLFTVTPPGRSSAHNALADAEYQTAHLHEIIRVHKLYLP
jgi:3'-5' exoribonuclease-like protein